MVTARSQALLTKIAEGHTINRIGELVPWRMIPDPKPSS
jgi:hypothetical protein